MLDNVKQIEPAVQIVPGPFRCISVDPEGSAQARTFYYKVVIPNPVQRHLASLFPSAFVHDLVLRTTL